MVEIDYEACVGCGRCANVCLTGAISVTLKMPRINSLACSACGQCIEVCRTGAIHWKDADTRKRPRIRPAFERGARRLASSLSDQEASRRSNLVRSDLSELKQRFQDLKRKAEEIAERIERL
jgi:MinD superfamily P-loop ATPase